MSSTIGDTTRLRGWADRLRNRDDSALNELLIHFEDQLVRLARRMLKGFPDVRDVEQTGDVLQKAARQARGRAPASCNSREFAPFLPVGGTPNTTRVNRPCGLLWQSCEIGVGSASVSTMGICGSNTLIDQTDGPSQLAEWTEFHEKVKLLPDDERQVFELVYYGGLSQSVTAEIIGVHPRTVRKRWHGAQLDLYEALGGQLPGS